jgi:O-antigen ligase
MKSKISLNIKLLNIINIQSLLLISLPLLLITGPFLSDLAVSLISILFLIKIYKDKKFKLINDNFFKLFFIFWIYLLLNSLLQDQNFDSLKISFFYIRFGLFVCATILILNENIKVLEYLFLSLLICFLILICDGFFQFFTEKNFFGFPLKEGSRVSSLFGDEQILGSYLSRLFPI